ncbi:unnamed protein product [Brassicogethes aeneus]|uniref:Uncharacterized protein n=1 Tax=Brassicogethes aeneus TaxID=1431903 RepID=A0A9P0B750_BRAAE|nr:unnamed protein product [Brassicogethes aeneus]
MNCLSFFLLIFVAVAYASHHEENYAPAHYKFEYGVHDPHTHDIKSQHEHRDGHKVNGGYTLKEADGTTRIVEYIGDHHNGFQAIVKRIGHAQHPAHYGHGHGDHGHGHGGVGGTSWVGVTHYGYKH